MRAKQLPSLNYYLQILRPIPSPLVTSQLAVSKLAMFKGITVSPNSSFLATAAMFLFPLWYVTLKDIECNKDLRTLTVENIFCHTQICNNNSVGKIHFICFLFCSDLYVCHQSILIFFCVWTGPISNIPNSLTCA